jgi:DNA topoisomerase-1
MTNTKRRRTVDDSDDNDVPLINQIAKKNKISGSRERNGAKERAKSNSSSLKQSNDDDGNLVVKASKGANTVGETKEVATTKKKKNESQTVKSNSKSSKIKEEEVTKVKSERKHFKNEAAAGTEPKKQLKELEKTGRLAHAMQAFLWWDAPEHAAGQQWVTMEHAGVSFPEPYEPHHVRMLYDGRPIDLTPVQEEAATFFAAMDPDGMHLGNPKTRDIFIKNFFSDFKAVLGKGHTIKEFSKCDFEPIRRHLDEKKIVKKAATDAEKKLSKAEREGSILQYGYAIVDGHIEKVGNFNMEPPGAFRGRGEHPKMGKLKQRVAPEQVALNSSECAPVPKCCVPGHAWGDLRHDPTVMWLANWKENINGQVKYMQLAAQSSFKGKSDRSKYNKAARLCDNIDKIRASYKSKLRSKDSQQRQLATAMWVIDRLALRVGGEKDTEEEADTVGCCSLRVEHLKFDPNNEGAENKEIELEFLGKDSMLFKQTIDFSATMYTENDGMGEQVYANFKGFCKGKSKNDEVFDSLTPTILNAHLKEIMEGLTAKVFRTYNASKTLQDELRKTEILNSWKSLSAAEKVVEYNNANRQVAILCNHQRSVSKAQETQLENLGAKLATLKDQKKVLKAILKRLNEGKTHVIPLKKSDKEMADAVTEAVERAKRMKEEATTAEKKIEATKADEAAKLQKREVAEAKFNQAHLWEKIPTIDQVVKRINAWTEKIAKMELDLKHKDDNKEVSLGTSKINYMDPRISVAFCKRNEIPIEKIFSRTLRDKFNWAMAVSPDWEFNAEIGKYE